MKSTLRLTLNRSIIVDQVAQFLIATKAVPYNAEIIDIDFVVMNEKCTLDVYFKDEEVKLTYYGDATP